jgi:hypothetical protein
MASYTTHLAELEKIRQSGFLNRSVRFLGIFQISDVSVSKIGCSSFYWLVPNGSFFKDKYKIFSLPPLEAAGSTNENTHPKAFVGSPQYLFVRFE